MTMNAQSTRPVFDRPVVLSLALTGLVFVIDLSLPLGVAAAVPYTFAVLLALKSRIRWFALALAATCWILTIAKLELQPERGTTELWKVLVNRALALFSIGMTTFLGIRRRQAETDRAEAEEKVREHLATLAHMGRLHTAGQLATGLAHELNQPLAAICLQAELAIRMTEEGVPVDEVLPNLQEIDQQSQRAAEIVRGLRRMLRPEEGSTTQVDLNEVVRTVAKLIDSQIRRAKVEFQLELSEVAPVHGNRVQLEQVVFNLLQNAIDALSTVTIGPRVVTITTSRREGDNVALSVRDSGVGLPADHGDRLFERFYTTKPNGMGIGLPIARSIVEAHGGKIWATPAINGGTVFTFTVPVLKR